MKEIQLTQGQVAKVDDWRFEEINKYKWFAQWSDATQSYYAVRQSSRLFGKQRAIRMHRVIIDTPEKMVCDHIDHDTLNNQEYNLRNCTYSQNQMNSQGVRKNNKHGNLGVSPHGKGWQAHISINKKLKWFPTRETIEEALEDRKQAEIENYGEYRGGAL